MDFPPSHVSLFLTLICRILEPSLSDSPPHLLRRMVDGANTKASPTRSFKICWKISSGFLFSPSTGICRRRTVNHSGLVKRWTTVIEHKSIKRGDIVGSWVEIITRTPKCRCCRITENNDSVSALEADESLMYCSWLWSCLENNLCWH